MRAARGLCAFALISNTACMSFQAPPPGEPLLDRVVQVTAPGGVELIVPNPDGSGQVMVCGAREFRGRLARIAADTVVFSSITARISDPGSAWACRSVRAGTVTARRGGALSLRTSQLNAVATFAVLGLVAALAIGISTAEWKYETVPATP